MEFKNKEGGGKEETDEDEENREALGQSGFSTNNTPEPLSQQQLVASRPSEDTTTQSDPRFVPFRSFPPLSQQPLNYTYSYEQFSTPEFVGSFSQFPPQLRNSNANLFYPSMTQMQTLMFPSIAPNIPFIPIFSNLQSSPVYTSSPHFTTRFVLHDQPSPRQRKSKKNENRFLDPNPIVICPKETFPSQQLPIIQGGIVTVKLANKNGEPLPDNDQKILVVKGGRRALHLDHNMSASFSLKLVDTPQGKTFRLHFTVNYTLENLGTREEIVMSHPFVIFENRPNNYAPPVVIDMKPDSGTANTEVWIKGKGFGERVQVEFDDKSARILESADNLITASVPEFSFTSDTMLKVVTSNKTPTDEIISAEKKLSFIYYPQRTEPPSIEEPKEE